MWIRTQAQNFRTSRGFGNKPARRNRRGITQTRTAFKCDECGLVASIPSGRDDAGWNPDGAVPLKAHGKHG